MNNAKNMFILKEAGFFSGLGKAISGISKGNAATGATGLAAMKNYATGIGKNVFRYAKKNPMKAGVGALAGYGAYKGLSGPDVVINNR